MGLIRGRLGVAVDRILFYVTGGVAFTEFEGSTRLGAVIFPGSSSGTGWILGGGFDWAMNPSWILGFEYLYGGLRHEVAYVPCGVPEHPALTQQARVRLSYRYRRAVLIGRKKPRSAEPRAIILGLLLCRRPFRCLDSDYISRP